MAVVLHTSCGDLPVLLKYAECPTASFNFLALCACRYFDGCCFYRHLPGILLQTGDPTNTGKGGESIFAKLPAGEDDDGGGEDDAFPPHLRTGGPRRYFDDEGFDLTTHNARGTLSMAHKGTKANTNASQFFILTSAQPSFDGLYTSFGNVDLSGVFDKATTTVVGQEVSADSASPALSGDATLAALEAAAAEVDEKNLVKDKEAVTITHTTILYNPFANDSVRR